MRRLRIALVCLVGLAALGVAGTGAGALRTVPFAPQPHWHGGHGEVVLSAPGASGNGTARVTLPGVGPTGSSFSTGPVPVTITNAGHDPASLVAIALSDRATSHTLRHELWTCVIVAGRQLVNEPLTVVESYGHASVPPVLLLPEGTSTFAVVTYAGPTQDTGCGGAMSDFHPWHWGGYGDGVAYPSGTSNPAAASLTNGAEGGMLELTVTTTYAGRDHDHRCRGWQDTAPPREEHDCR
jgi:hypothetical protein